MFVAGKIKKSVTKATDDAVWLGHPITEWGIYIFF